MRLFTLKILICSLALALPATIYAAETNELSVWDKALKEMSLLPPSSFSDLPRQVFNDLEKQKCLIPQAYELNSPHNIISGSFQKKGQIDWAVLCSINGFSTIRVYWGGQDKGVSEIKRSQDKYWFQGLGDNNIGYNIGYSRLLGIADEKYILEHYQYYGGTKPPPINHQGINEIFMGKASEVHYYYKNKWLDLTGAD